MALDSEGTLHLLTGEGEYAFWDGQFLSSAVDLRPLPEQTENARLVIVNGNQLLVVIGPFFGPGIYYTVNELPVPALPTAEPPSKSQATATPAPTIIAEATSTLAATATVVVLSTGAFTSATRQASSAAALPLSVGLSLGLIVAVVIIRLSRRR
jgi:hypothetical protein